MSKCKGQCPYHWPKTLNDDSIKECKNCSNVISYNGENCPCCGETLKESHISKAKNLAELERKEKRLLQEMGYETEPENVTNSEPDESFEDKLIENSHGTLPKTNGKELSQELPDTPESVSEDAKPNEKKQRSKNSKSNNKSNQSKK